MVSSIREDASLMPEKELWFNLSVACGPAVEAGLWADGEVKVGTLG